MIHRNETLQRSIGAYFAACDATRERMPLKNGGFEERQIPYTLFGLARAAQVPLETLLDAYRKPRRTARDRILFDAVLRVAAYTQERAMLGELTYQVALETLRAIEGTAQQDGEGSTLKVLMDEPAARYAI